MVPWNTSGIRNFDHTLSSEKEAAKNSIDHWIDK